MKADKIWKPVLHVALAVGITWLVVLFTAIFGAAALNSAEDGTENTGAVLLFSVYHLVFYIVLILVRHFQNDDLENDFIRKHRETPYRSMRDDLTEAVTSEIVVYLLVYFCLGLSMILALTGAGNGIEGAGNMICFALIPINFLVMLVHPILGFLIHLILFTGIYTYAVLLIRRRWASGSFGTGGSGVVSKQHLDAMRWSRQNRR